jgi:hypothetical protein
MLLEKGGGGGKKERNMCLQKSLHVDCILANLIKSLFSQPVSVNFKSNRIYLNLKNVSKKLEGVVFIFVYIFSNLFFPSGWPQECIHMLVFVNNYSSIILLYKCMFVLNTTCSWQMYTSWQKCPLYYFFFPDILL